MVLSWNKDNRKNIKMNCADQKMDNTHQKSIFMEQKKYQGNTQNLTKYNSYEERPQKTNAKKMRREIMENRDVPRNTLGDFNLLLLFQ